MNTDSHSQPVSNHREEEQEICPKCMAGNLPGAPYCLQCGARLSSNTTADPIESTMLYSTVAERPQRLVVVIGVWAVFGIFAITGATMVGISWNMGDRWHVLLGLGLLVFSVIMITKTTRNYLNRKVINDEAND